MLKRKKIIKKIAIIMLILCIAFLEYKTFAIKASELNPEYGGIGELNITIERFGGSILGFIRNITAISSVILIAFFGLKFMFGSVEQKAEYKKHFMPLIVGMVVVVAGTSIASFVWNFGDDANTYASCEHQLPSGVHCGDDNAICTKCNMHISSHDYKRVSVPGGGYYDECKYCHYIENRHYGPN